MPDRPRYGKASSSRDVLSSPKTKDGWRKATTGDFLADTAKKTSNTRKKNAASMGPQAAGAQDAEVRKEKYQLSKANAAADASGLTKAERDKALEIAGAKRVADGRWEMSAGDAARAVEKAAEEKAKRQKPYKDRKPGSARGGSGASSSRSEAVKKAWITRKRGARGG